MKSTINSFFFLFLILVLESSLFYVEVTGETELLPEWEYIVPEINYLTLHGGLAQWSDFEPVTITLDDLSGSGDTLQFQAYFGYNGTEFYIGLLVPKGDYVVNGLEIIFFGNGVSDGIIVDSDLHEGRDVVYVNHTYVAYDTDLGGREEVNVAISDEGDDEFYMIVDDIRFPEGDLGSNWEFDEGDSVAVVFQAWVDKPMDDVNRPNFSTVALAFNYLRLSIKEDSGWLVEPQLPWDLMWEESDLPEVSYHEREDNITLDGKKDEDCWIHASSSKTKLFLISKTAPTSLLHTADPSYIEVTITFTYDKDYLYMFLEIPHESNDTDLEELIMVFGNDQTCLQNLSASLLLVKINPSDESFVRSGINAELRVPGIVPTLSPVYYGVVSTVSTYGIQDLSYGTFRDFGPHGVENVEVRVPVFGIASGAIRPLTDSDSPDTIHLAEMTIQVSDLDPSDPYDNPWSAMTLEDEQLYFNLYEITFLNETSKPTPTRTISFFSTTMFILLPFVWVLTLRKRKFERKL